MPKVVESAGFSPPTGRVLGQERRTAVFAELIASLALAVCTIVAAAVVTMGIARASIATGVIDDESSLFGLAMLLGLAFIGLGGFSLLPSGTRTSPRK